MKNCGVADATKQLETRNTKLNQNKKGKVKMKIRSTKAFKAKVDETFEVQNTRDKLKSEYDASTKAFKAGHDELCEYAMAHGEVFEGTKQGASYVGRTDKVEYTYTISKPLARLDGGRLDDPKFLAELESKNPSFVRVSKEINKLAIKGAGLSDTELAELGLWYAPTPNMKFKEV